ncbi:MAG: HAMP domain-containing sensor histidine kinase [Bdellovibrionota bacterium]
MINSLFTFGTSDDLEMAKLVWLVRLRWAVILLFFFLAAPAYIFGFLTSATLTFYIGIICFLFLFNWLTQLTFISPTKKITPFFICFQLALDLIVLFSLLMITDGFVNPFIGLFILNAGLGAVLIRGQYSWPFIIICHVLLVALQLDYIINNINQLDKYNFLFMFVAHLLVFATWIVMRSLGSYLENHFKNFAQIRLRAERQDRLRSLGALAAGFSHEFASPLNTAKLRLDRLQKYLSKLSPSHEINENITEAQMGIAACESVIHQMNCSQLDVRDFRTKNISVNDLITDVIDSWKEENPEALLEIKMQKNINLQIPPINFAQVILNLLDNAIEASRHGKIQLLFDIDNDHARLIIHDEGPGFSDQILNRQGEPFITTKDHGTGLGLYVSNLFAQSLGGQLSLANKSPRGGQVMISWPLGVLHE